jgi:hypothetical protein
MGAFKDALCEQFASSGNALQFREHPTQPAFVLFIRDSDRVSVCLRTQRMSLGPRILRGFRGGRGCGFGVRLPVARMQRRFRVNS